MTKLEIRQLSFSYPGRPILEELSLEIHAGEIVVLLGANGAGKTTLLRMMARQIQPANGAVLIDSRELRSFGRLELAQNVSLMPQSEQRDVGLSVIDVVSLGRVPHRGWMMPLTSDDHSKIRAAMEATGTWELRDRSIQEVSGGEWRRMILARAIAQDASVLLLDEPTAGLDLKYQFECLENIQRLVKERGLSAMISLHDLNQAAMFADRIALLSGHRLLALGSPHQVLTADLLEKSFGIRVEVLHHPTTKLPLIVPTKSIHSAETSA